MYYCKWFFTLNDLRLCDLFIIIANINKNLICMILPFFKYHNWKHIILRVPELNAELKSRKGNRLKFTFSSLLAAYTFISENALHIYCIWCLKEKRHYTHFIKIIKLMSYSNISHQILMILFSVLNFIFIYDSVNISM